MLLSYLDNKLTTAYIRFVNYLHPTPPMEEYYAAPPSTTTRGLPVDDYAEKLVNGYGRPHPKQKPPGTGVSYRIAQLNVTDAYHMKERSRPEHEYIILITKVADGLDTFYLKVERRWDEHKSLFQLSSDDMKNFKASLSEEERVQLQNLSSQTPATPPPSDTRAPPSSSSRRDNSPQPSTDKSNTSWARSGEFISSSSPKGSVSGPACDTVSAGSSKDIERSRSTLIVEHIAFKGDVLPLVQAMGMAAAVSRKFAIYTPFNHQCYFYAATLLDCFKRSAEQARASFRVLESREVARGVQEVALDENRDDPKQDLGWQRQGKKSRKGGRFLDIPIFEFRQKAFDGVTWPACEEYLAIMKTQLDETTRHEREMEEQVKVRDEQLRTRDEQLRARDEQLRARDEQLEALEKQKDAEIKAANERMIAIQKQNEELQKRLQMQGGQLPPAIPQNTTIFL